MRDGFACEVRTGGNLLVAGEDFETVSLAIEFLSCMRLDNVSSVQVVFVLDVAGSHDCL